MDKNIIVRVARESDFEWIFPLCEKRFGEGYMTYEEYNSWLKNPEFCLVAEYDGDFAGFVCYLPSTAEDLSDYMQLEADYIKTVSKKRPVLHCKTAVMVEKYEHYGIMQILVDTANKNGKRLGFGAAFAPAWEYNNYVPVEKMLLRLGFLKIAKKENIWYGMENYTCVVCGGRCKCSAVIFQKKL